MNTMKLALTLSTVAALAVACGGAERDVDARLDLPAVRESKIALRPALDVSRLYDPAIADRIVIEEIDLNVSDVRLLGSDPRVPAGGLPLLARAVVLEAFDGQSPGLELPFPGYLADQDDLAVYIRVDKSAELLDSSVVIRGRVYAHPVHGGSTGLTATDGEGHMFPDLADNVKSIDPDGDPADGPEDAPSNPDCSIDPDGDPAICQGRRRLVSRGETSKYVPFELRGDDVADLITGVESNGKLDVVIGIPASRWFTPQAMRAIDRELAEPVQQASGKLGEHVPSNELVVIESRLAEQVEAAKEEMESEEYFAAEDKSGLDDIKIRRPDRD